MARGLFPLTRAGSGLLALSILATWTQGIAHKDVVLLTAARMTLGLEALLCAAVLVTALLGWWRCRRARAAAGPVLAETGCELPTGFAVSFPDWLPFVTLSWTWTQPPGIGIRLRRQSSRITEILLARHRGAGKSIRRSFTVRDFLGLCAITWTAAEPNRFRILPARSENTEAAVALAAGTGEDLPDPYGAAFGDPVETREYRHGDSPRLVRWKLYARTGKLIVRAPERALSDQPTTCAYLLGGAPAETAAGLVREMLESGYLGAEFFFGAEGSARVAEGDLELAGEILAESGMADAQSVAGLPAFLTKAAQAGYSNCLLFASPRTPGKRLAEMAGASSVNVRLVVCVTQLEPAAPPSLWKRIVFERSRHGVALGALAKRFEPCAGLCAPQVFEQQTGGFFAL